MINHFILSERGFCDWPSYDLVYEWEDELVGIFPHSSIYKEKEFLIFGKRFLSGLYKMTGINMDRWFVGGKRSFRFDMYPRLRSNPWNSPNVDVCIVDFYLTEDKLDAFYKAYDKVRCLYVSSREVYDYLQTHHPKRKVFHMPLTLPGKYRLDKNTCIDKKYDLVMVGRQNPVLLEYLKRFEQSHDILYVYRGAISSGHFPYYTNKGDYVGNIVSRADYFNLMRQGKIALYSTPGMDGGEKHTHGFSQVTPRFLEEISCGCHVIARYVDNSDTDFFELGKMTTKVDTYEEFEKAMLAAMETRVDLECYSNYLDRHYTSCLANLYEYSADF